MVDSLLIITLRQLLLQYPILHGTNPLLAEDRILRGFERLGIAVIDAIKGRGNFRLAGEEVFGFGDWHFGELETQVSEELRGRERAELTVGELGGGGRRREMMMQAAGASGVEVTRIRSACWGSLGCWRFARG